MNAEDGSSLRDNGSSGFRGTSLFTGDLPHIEVASMGDDEERQRLLEFEMKIGDIRSELNQAKEELCNLKIGDIRSELNQAKEELCNLKIGDIRSELNQAKEELCNLKDSTLVSLGEEEQQKLLDAETKVGEIDGIRSELNQQKEELAKLNKSNTKTGLPADTYSMMMIPFSGTRVAIFSILVFLFQVGLLALIIVDFSDGPAFKPRFNPPPDVSPTVRASQFLAIIIALLTQDDTLVSLTILLSPFSTEGWNTFLTQFQSPEDRTSEEAVVNRSLKCSCFWPSWCNMEMMKPRQVYHASNGLRLVQGLLGLLISMIIIIQSYSIIDLFKDFAAMAFISTLDNVAFSLANQGFFGTYLSNSADKVTAAQLPEMTRTKMIWREAMLFFLYAGMLIGWSFVVFQQLNGEWLPQSVAVQFGDGEDFAIQAYSGVYERTVRHRRVGGRFIYRETSRNPTDEKRGHFVYCDNIERWTFFTSTDSEDLSAQGCFTGTQEFESDGGETILLPMPKPRAFSPTTHTYDLSTVPTTGWSISDGVAMVPLSYISFFSNDCSDDNECGLETDPAASKRTGTCNTASKRCECSDGYYGEKCRRVGPCESLKKVLGNNNTIFGAFFQDYAVLKRAIFHGEPVLFHGEPVYVNDNDTDDYEMVIFAGRRWVLLKRSHILEHLRTKNHIGDPDSSLNIYSFNEEMFDFAMRNTELLHSVQFVSEPAIAGTPNALRWYRRLPRDSNGNSLLLGPREQIRKYAAIDATFDCSSFGFKYKLYCQVANPSWIGDGVCDGGAYNTKQCGSDMGDCDEFNRLYPNCTVEDPSYIGDSECDESGGYNTEECGYDGGDCCQESCIPGEYYRANCDGPWDHCVDPNFKYCQVEALSRIGDGWCDIGDYNTEQCGWDEGDCAVEGYPDCHVGCPSCIGDGYCDLGEYNTEECGWDGGDCDEFNRLYPNCTVDYPLWIGDGDCHGGEYYTEQCGWDGGDCFEFNGLYPNCTVENPSYIGDGFCDDFLEGYNTEECGYDGGDCCQESCIPVEGWGNCTGPWDHCVDPKYSQRN